VTLVPIGIWVRLAALGGMAAALGLLVAILWAIADRTWRAIDVGILVIMLVGPTALLIRRPRNWAKFLTVELLASIAGLTLTALVLMLSMAISKSAVLAN